MEKNFADDMASVGVLIKKAMEKRHMISFCYFSPNGESNRRIEPYHLVFQWSAWYVWGYCTERKDYRMFKLTRMTELAITEEMCADEIRQNLIMRQQSDDTNSEGAVAEINEEEVETITVALSVNTLDENFKNDMDNASSISDRLATLKELYDNNIYTVLFMSPMFPELTDYKAIIEKSHSYISEYWFENLNLRGKYKQTILEYINQKYPQYAELYRNVFTQNKKEYWDSLALEIEKYCDDKAIKHITFFYHKELVEQKKTKLLESY